MTSVLGFDDLCDDIKLIIGLFNDKEMRLLNKKFNNFITKQNNEVWYKKVMEMYNWLLPEIRSDSYHISGKKSSTEFDELIERKYRKYSISINWRQIYSLMVEDSPVACGMIVDEFVDVVRLARSIKLQNVIVFCRNLSYISIHVMNWLNPRLKIVDYSLDGTRLGIVVDYSLDRMNKMNEIVVTNDITSKFIVPQTHDFAKIKMLNTTDFTNKSGKMRPQINSKMKFHKH